MNRNLRLLAFVFVIFAVLITGTKIALSFTPPSPPPPTKNVYEVIKSRKDLSKFADLIGDADLKDLFTAAPDEPITVFVPNNDAIGDISRDTMKRIKANDSSLQSYIKYHIISGSLVSSGAIQGRRASPAAANGEALQFDGLTDKDKPKVNDATLVEADIRATNGIIHIVSTGLVPPSLQNGPVASPPAAAVPEAVAPVAAAPPAPAPAPAPAKAKAAAVTTTGAATAPASTSLPTTTTAQPSPPPAGSETGFTLFGHKFSW